MKAFAALYEALDRTTSTKAKVAAMAAYFRTAPPADAAWALFFLTGRRINRLLPVTTLHAIALAVTGLPEWLLAESYQAVGDYAETLSLLVPGGSGAERDLPLDAWMRERVLPLQSAAAGDQQEAIRRYWSELSPREAFVLNKVLTGEFRVGVAATLVVRALAEVAGVPAATMAHRLMGDWAPTAEFFSSRLSDDTAGGGEQPYPFYLASPLDAPPSALGAREDWLAEWKWDGIRAQLIRRDEITLWSRGEVVITERFPELTAAAGGLPRGTVLDGEVVIYRDGAVQPFALLQTRIGRQKLTPRILSDAPAALIAFDLLEREGADLRAQPLDERRRHLAQLLEGRGPALRLSPEVAGASWEELARERESARARRVEGLMLKRRDAPYRAGRPRGEWWKWKIAPFTIDAVMIYAHPGHGKRASLFTDYTFAVWNEGALVPIARAYSGLSDAEIRELDAWIRGHVREQFGPVRAVEPVQVFELAFENVALSRRHKAGVAVRFPRILRWRRDKRPEDADRLESLRALVTPVTPPKSAFNPGDVRPL